MVPKAVRKRVRPGPLLSSGLPQRSQLRCRARNLAAWAVTTPPWMLTSAALASSNDRPITSSRSSPLSKCRISPSLITLSSSATIRSWISIRMLVPKAATVDATTYPPIAPQSTPISHTSPCSLLQPRRFLVALDLLDRGLPDVDDREPLAMLPPDLLRCEAALTRHQLSGHHRSSLRQPEHRGSAAGPSVREAARRCAAAPSAASPRPGRSKLRSSRDPSQRTRAHNAWNPTLGTSPISVKLSEGLLLGFGVMESGLRRP